MAKMKIGWMLVDGAILLVVYNIILTVMGMVSGFGALVKTILDFGYGFLTLGAIISLTVALPIQKWVNDNVPFLKR